MFTRHFFEKEDVEGRAGFKDVIAREHGISLRSTRVLGGFWPLDLFRMKFKSKPAKGVTWEWHGQIGILLPSSHGFPDGVSKIDVVEDDRLQCHKDVFLPTALNRSIDDVWAEIRSGALSSLIRTKGKKAFRGEDAPHTTAVARQSMIQAGLQNSLGCESLDVLFPRRVDRCPG